MKKIILSLLAGFTSIVSAEETLNIYSQRHYDADKIVFAKFTEKTGIKVNVVKGSADELVERIKSEGEKTPADVLITKDAARLVWADAEGLFQPVASETLTKQVPSHLRDPENKWFGLTQRARVLIYSKERVKAGELTSYDDITMLANSEDPKDREVASKVAICFPEQSGKGTHVNISGAGVLKHSSNKENAIKFIEFMTSPEAQTVYPDKTYEYPLSLKLESDLHKSWGTFKPDSLNLEELGKNNAKAVELFQAAKWE